MHASQLDLGCASYDEGVDWISLKAQLHTFLRAPFESHAFLADMLLTGRERRQSDCYIGLCCLGYLALLFMPPEKRARAMKETLFGSVSLHDQIPLSYWDTLASGWPIFGLLELVAAEVRRDGLPPPPGAVDGCCDFLPAQGEEQFRRLLEGHLLEGSAVQAPAALRYLSMSPTRCSWGKASAYFALAEELLLAGGRYLQQAAKDLIVLGELQLDRCAQGRNVTVHEHMLSAWPFWSLLRRIELHSTVDVPSLQLRLPPGYAAPPMLSGSPSMLGATNLEAASAGAERGPSSTAPAERAGVPQGDGGCHSRDVHVAFAGDRGHSEGVLAAISSLLQSTRTPGRLCLHVFCLGQEADFYRSALRCSFGPQLAATAGGGGDEWTLQGAALRLHQFERGDVLTTGLAVDGGVTVEAGNLNAPHNFVRFHLARWVPPRVAPRLVYLDTDVVVLADICDLYDEAVGGAGAPGKIIAAVPRPHLPLAVHLKVFSPRMPVWLPSTAPSFNAGVMVIDLEAWEGQNVTALVDRWACRNQDRELWRHGSQPPLLLLLYDRVHWLGEAWNVDGLGHYSDVSASALAGAKILHWTGPLKPWAPNGLRKELWEPFSVHCWRGFESQLAV